MRAEADAEAAAAHPRQAPAGRRRRRRALQRLPSAQAGRGSDELPPDEEEGRGRGGPQTANITPGLNRFTWDLQYQPVVSFPGMVLWGATTNGPVALPGTYQVRLTVDGQAQTQPLTVKKHPYHEATEADLQAQFDLASQIRDKVNEANDAVIQIRRIKQQVDDRLEEEGRRRPARDRESADARADGCGGRGLSGPQPEQSGSVELPDQDQQSARVAAAGRRDRRRQADEQHRRDLQRHQDRVESADGPACSRCSRPTCRRSTGWRSAWGSTRCRRNRTK